MRLHLTVTRSLPVPATLALSSSVALVLTLSRRVSLTRVGESEEVVEP